MSEPTRPTDQQQQIADLAAAIADYAGNVSATHAGLVRKATTILRAQDHLAFIDGWNAGFREANEPDRRPDQDRCQVAYEERLASGQPTVKRLLACISCGEDNDGGFETEDGVGPFCSTCWDSLKMELVEGYGSIRT